MTFYLVSHVMPKHLLDNPCAMHPVISVDHWARDRQYKHAVHKSQVVHTTNRFPLGAIVRIQTCPSQSAITAKQVFTLFLFFYISNTTHEPSDLPAPLHVSLVWTSSRYTTHSSRQCMKEDSNKSCVVPSCE